MDAFLVPIIGSDADTILWWQMVVRGLLIFFYGLILIRLAPVRAFGGMGAFDVVLAVILGSILSRTLTANAPFLPSLAAAATLVLLHCALAKWSAHSRRIGFLVKGEPVRLIVDGAIDERAMHRVALGPGDLHLALRANGMSDFSEVEAAYLERNGNITFIRK